MYRANEFQVVKYSFIILTLISVLLIILRLIGKAIFRFDFEFFIFHIPALTSIFTYLYLNLKERKQY